jgi:hypothetical protein
METHVSILRRVGIALLGYVVVRTVGLVIDFATGASHSVTIDLLSTILGILLIRGSLGAARWLAFICAFEVVTTAIVAVVGVPLALLFGLLPWHLDMQGAWQIAATILDVVFALWVLGELKDPIVGEAMAAAGRGPIRRAQTWGIGCALASLALAVAIAVPVAIMWPRWTAPARAEAHRQLGNDWDVSVTSYQSGSRGWRAHVVARRAGEVRELDVGSAPASND